MQKLDYHNLTCSERRKYLAKDLDSICGTGSWLTSALKYYTVFFDCRRSELTIFDSSSSLQLAGHKGILGLLLFDPWHHGWSSQQPAELQCPKHQGVHLFASEIHIFLQNRSNLHVFAGENHTLLRNRSNICVFASKSNYETVHPTCLWLEKIVLYYKSWTTYMLINFLTHLISFAFYAPYQGQKWQIRHQVETPLSLLLYALFAEQASYQMLIESTGLAI
jgi:hypothetical protein